MKKSNSFTAVFILLLIYSGFKVEDLQRDFCHVFKLEIKVYYLVVIIIMLATMDFKVIIVSIKPILINW
jgi:hypothetical protein